MPSNMCYTYYSSLLLQADDICSNQLLFVYVKPPIEVYQSYLNLSLLAGYQ